MEETDPKKRELEGEGSGQSSRQVNWWGIFGLLCGIGSAYLSLRIFFEAVTLLGNGP